MIYELRTYTCRPAKRRVLLEIMEKLMPVFEKAGIRVVGLWTTVIGRSEDFVYMLEYESLADREKKWGSFVSDPDLRRIMAEAGEYPNYKEINVILQPTSFSPLR